MSQRDPRIGPLHADAELLELGRKIIDDMCHGDRWRMSIPVHRDDSDILLSELLDRFRVLLEKKAPEYVSPARDDDALFDGYVTFSEDDRQKVISYALEVIRNSDGIGGWDSIMRWAIAAMTYEATLRWLEALLATDEEEPRPSPSPLFSPLLEPEGTTP